MRAIALALLMLSSMVIHSGIGVTGTLDGQTITYVVATKPGGGYDAYGRLVAKYMEKHLPGTTFVVKNVPGGGQRIGAETIYASSPDGRTIGTFNTSLIYGQIAGMEAGELDLSKMSWIGKAATESRVLMVSAKSEFMSMDNVKKAGRPIKIAVNGKGSSGHFESALIARILGIELQHIFGFEADEGALGLMRGEIDMTIGSRSSLQKFVDSGEGRFVLGYGAASEADVPQLRAMPVPEQYQPLLSLIEGQGRISRVTSGPPGIPEATLKELRAAYIAALTDPGLLAEASQQRLPIDPVGGEEVAKEISAALNQAPDIAVEIKRLVSE